jgi:hypothetical protein
MIVIKWIGSLTRAFSYKDIKNGASLPAPLLASLKFTPLGYFERYLL